MHGLWSASLTGRLAFACERRLAAVWPASLTGRLFSRAWLLIRAAASGSALLSLRSAQSRVLCAGAPSAAERSLAAVLSVSERWLGDRLAGRVARAVGISAGVSAFAGGRWLRPAGAATAAYAAARLAFVGASAESRVAGITFLGALGLAGLLALVAGPRLVVRPRASLTAGLAGSLDRLLPGAEGVAAHRDQDGSGGPTSRFAQGLGWAVTGLALLAGAFAGATPGIGGPLVAAAAAAAVGASFVLYRPEALLVVLAAFPWVDWAARRALAASGFAGLWDEMLLLGSLAALTFVVIVLRRWDIGRVPIVLPLGLAVVAAAGSAVVRQVPGDVAVFALRVTFQPLLFFFLGYLLPRDRRWVRAAVGVFLVAGLALALHGLYQYATHAPMPAKWVDVRETSIGTRAYSILENPNGLGAYLLMGSLLAGSLALHRLPGRQRLVAAGAALVLLAGLVATFSRGAWLGFIVGFAAMAALSQRRLLGAMVVAGLLSPFVAPAAVVERFTFAFSSEYLTKSAAAGRLLMWRAALQHIVDHPWFGLGLGTFGGTSSFLFGYSRLWVDNFYLQLAAEGGLILLVAFLWVLLRTAKSLMVAHQMRSGDPFLRAVAAGVFGGFVAVCFANLTAGVWETLAVGAGFWFLAGLAASLASPLAPLPRARDATPTRSSATGATEDAASRRPVRSRRPRRHLETSSK